MKRRFLVVLPALLLLLWPAAAQAQDAITELAVIYGGSSNIQCSAGFTKYPVDLNKGAGGDFIYLCYKRGVGAPVTGITAGMSGDPVTQEQVPAGWTLIPVDLNRNAGGWYIYLIYTKYPGQADNPLQPDDPVQEPDCRTVRDIVVLEGTEATPAGYVKNNVDLNRGTDKTGAALFFAYKEE